MRFLKGVILCSIFFAAGAVFSQDPTSPMSDSVPVTWVYGSYHGAPYSGIEITDTEGMTAPFFTWHPGFGIDTTLEELHQTGYSFESLIGTYFSYDYQFTSDVLWSGFKLMWEEHGFAWDLRGYDSLVITYTGLLPQHKAIVTFGESIDPYSDVTLDSVGILPAFISTLSKDSLAAWKTLSIPIPPAPENSIRENVREIRFIIHDTGSTPHASAVGNFSYYQIAVKKAGGAGISGRHVFSPLINNRGMFTPSIAGPVTLSLFNLNGRLLSNTSVAVVQGKQYSVGQFISANSNAPVSGVYLVRLNGAGVSLRQKMWVKR